jgi:hypothetical protein
MRRVELWERRRFLVLPLLGLVGLVLGVAVAAAGTATNARGLELVGANDFDELTPTRNSEIALRGSFAYVGSLRPLDAAGLSQGVKVVDVSNPASPRLVSNFPLPGGIQDVTENGDKDRCGFGKQVRGLGDPMCNSMLVSMQTAPGRHGIWLLDVRDPANAKPWAWDPSKPFEQQISFVHFAPGGSHTSYFFGDFAFVTGIGSRNTFEIWDVSGLAKEPATAPVRVAWYNNRNDTRPERPRTETVGSHDSYVQRMPDGRVLIFVVGSNHFNVVDVTDVVEGSTTGDISDHVIAYNNYFNADGTITVSPANLGNTFPHNVEATADGRHAYVGDETIWCGDPGIVRIFDTARLPNVGETPRRLSEIGTMRFPTSSTPLCANRNADDDTPELQNRHGDTQLLCRSSHNFRIYGNLMTHGAYCEGTIVWDITNRASPTIIAHSNATKNHDGKSQQATGAQPTAREGDVPFGNVRYVWTALADGGEDAIRRGEAHIYASDIVNGVYVLRMRPIGEP